MYFTVLCDYIAAIIVLQSPPLLQSPPFLERGKKMTRKLDASELTEKMKVTLREVAYGVRKYKGGYYSIEDPTIKVDGRSLEALWRRGLIEWDSVGGAVQKIHLYLTPQGDRIFEEELRFSDQKT